MIDDMPPGCPYHGNRWMEPYTAHPMHSPANNQTVWNCMHPTAQIRHGKMNDGCSVIIILGGTL